jgi:hypothetical protein
MEVSLTILLKTNVEKMSALKSVTMLMKTSELYQFETMSMKSQELQVRSQESGFRSRQSAISFLLSTFDFRFHRSRRQGAFPTQAGCSDVPCVAIVTLEFGGSRG